MDNLIITPENPQFYPILHSKLPPGSKVQAYGVDTDTGMLKPLTPQQEREYVCGGEMAIAEAQRDSWA